MFTKSQKAHRKLMQFEWKKNVLRQIFQQVQKTRLFHSPCSITRLENACTKLKKKSKDTFWCPKVRIYCNWWDCLKARVNGYLGACLKLPKKFSENPVWSPHVRTCVRNYSCAFKKWQHIAYATENKEYFVEVQFFRSQTIWRIIITCAWNRLGVWFCDS